MSKGASVNVSCINTSPHVGTHADAPLHVKKGAPGTEELPLEAFYGKSIVVDVTDVEGAIEYDLILEKIGEAVLSGSSSRQYSDDDFIERILLKTGHTIAKGTFPDTWPCLSRDCAEQLVGRGLKLLGVDCPSVDQRESKTLEVHHELFDSGAFVLENLDLRKAEIGVYDLIAFPTKLLGLDGAPVRAVLMK